ncbi:hypothetical protein DOY81_003144 [Sarcophaga bullata]|nr:hypothetical protein DOY81_003144 [Sarcophaga bullata]
MLLSDDIFSYPIRYGATVKGRATKARKTSGRVPQCNIQKDILLSFITLIICVVQRRTPHVGPSKAKRITPSRNTIIGNGRGNHQSNVEVHCNCG